MYRTKPYVFLAMAVLVAALSFANPATSDEGQGTAQPGSTLSQLQPGALVYGSPTNLDQYLGRVVVVNIGGA